MKEGRWLSVLGIQQSTHVAFNSGGSLPSNEGAFTRYSLKWDIPTQNKIVVEADLLAQIAPKK